MRELDRGSVDELEAWIGRLQNLLEDGSQYPIFLVALGEKRGAVSMNVSEEQIQSLKRFCERLGLKYRTAEGRKSKPSRNVMEKTERDQNAFFVSREGSWFDILEEGRFYGYSDRSVGEFLGFPKSSIEFFVENEQPAMRSREQISKMNKEQGLEADIRYLNLVTYIPAPEESEILKAVKKGRLRAEKLSEFDGMNDSELGEHLLEKRLSGNLYR